jgi:hypothetical protein
MENYEIFDRYMKDHGGRLKRDIIPAEVWQNSYGQIIALADELIASARSFCPSLPPIHFDFVQNQNINAMAFKAEGKYFIAFNTGTRYMLELVFFRMLSDARLFDFVPGAIEEDAELPPLEYSVNAEEMYRAGVRPARPKSDARWAYACSLLRSAFLFLIAHEIAHITFGHVDWVARSGNAILSEVGWNLTNKEDLLERQAMEADADMRSVYSAVASIKLQSDAPMSENPGWISSRTTVNDLLFDWSVAMNAMFRIFGDIQVEEPMFDTVSHPPFPLRRMMAIWSAGLCVAHLWNLTDVKNVIKKVLMRGAFYTELAFMNIMNQEEGARGLSQAFSRPGLDYWRRIVDYSVHTLAKKLKPFAYESHLIQPSFDGALEDAIAAFSSEVVEDEHDPE